MATATILLDVATWDIALDRSGNWAVAPYPYALAQDAACQIRLFRGEIIFDTAQGVPYWQQILGYTPSVQLMTARFEEAALLVPGVHQAAVVITSVKDRFTRGTVYVTDQGGQAASTGF